MPISKEDFRGALSRFASGITVVTSVDDAGRLHGMTVSAFCSVSLEPPLILICISKDTGSHDSIAKIKKFAVNILREDQAELSERFSAPVEDKFGSTEYHESPDGLPLLNGALANLECRLVHSYDGGDHTVYVGEVENAAMFGGQPLLHFRGDYKRIAGQT
jgi:flavin reductase (DIM6/NTAB) family NADH-FMN oxidoreductase RutF